MSQASFERTRFWRESLEFRLGDEWERPRERLRAAFHQFRERARILAQQIESDLPDFTVHDITHLDGLWETAEVIAGDEVSLNAAEGFVLGGAFLVHDLAMTLAAYPGGREELIRHERWADTEYAHIERNLGHSPSVDELSSLRDTVVQSVTMELLRELHAERAALLPQTAFKDQNDDEQYYLIDDVELRKSYGNLIGLLGASHGQDASSLADSFSVPAGAPGFLPPSWEVDAFKLACLLRVADASHLDERRAPGFLRALRRPRGVALDHWWFQDHLTRPYRDGDRLVFTAGRPFPPSKASAWWTCLDTLRMVDRELRDVDALLADARRTRFAVRSVAGISDPSRFVAFVQTHDWLPVNARVHISDVLELVTRLGGQELYGHNDIVPLRELIENGADAVRARRALGVISGEPPGSVPLQVTITVGETKDQNDKAMHWIEVSDSGIGMSSNILTGPLLDFGHSFWGTSEARKELPGLSGTEFRPVGRYGIGFFSVFMLGREVSVTTRRFDQAHSDTYVLEFAQGLEGRPLLRRARADERLALGGTKVRVALDHPLHSDVLETLDSFNDPESLAEFVAWLLPTSDIRLEVNVHGSDSHSHRKALGTIPTPITVLEADDWAHLDAKELLRRVLMDELQEDRRRRRRPETYDEEAIIEQLASNVRDIYSNARKLVGRAAIHTELAWIHFGSTWDTWLAPVTVGGARSDTRVMGVAGVLTGRSVRAARDSAVPEVDNEALSRWATDQASLLTGTFSSTQAEQNAAKAVLSLLGDPGGLRLMPSADGWMTKDQIRDWASSRSEIFIVHPAYVFDHYTDDEDRMFRPLADNIISLEISLRYALRMGSSVGMDWPSGEFGSTAGGRWLWPALPSLPGVLINVTAEAWAVPVAELAQQITRETRIPMSEVVQGDNSGHMIKCEKLFRSR
jgi:hypothetical protein